MLYQLLFAEDEPKIRRFVAINLKATYGETMIYHEAPDGGEALKIISANPKQVGSNYGEGIDLLITDIQMPVKNGLELIAEAQKISPGTKCILTTANAEKYADEANKLNIEIVEKPFDIPHLLATVAKYLPLQKK